MEVAENKAESTWKNAEEADDLYSSYHNDNHQYNDDNDNSFCEAKKVEQEKVAKE